jgi:phosphomannomutase
VGTRKPLDTTADYIGHLLGYVDRSALRPLRIVANAGNGMAGRVVERLETQLPFEFVKVQFEPDGSFPNGVPNPLLPEARGVDDRRRARVRRRPRHRLGR